MLDSVRQAAPPPPPPPPPPPRATDTAVASYASGWNPSVSAPTPAPAPAPEPQGFFGKLGDALSHGDVRAVASTVRDGVGDATDAGRSGITSAVNWTGETVGHAADAARSQITGNDVVSQGLRGAITGVENITRFQVGVTGGVLREGVGLLGSVGQLGTTLVEAQVSPQARQELGDKVVGAIGNALDATGGYLSSVANDPSRLGGDLKGAWNAASGFVSSTADRYGTALAEGRTEEIGLDVGTVATYVVPVGGGPARALLSGAARASTEGIARGGATALTRGGGDVVSSIVREATPGVTRTAANDVGTLSRAANDAGPVLRGPADRLGAEIAPQSGALPQAAAREMPAGDLHAQAQMAEHVYGRGALPAGTREVTEASELSRLNLDPSMLDRGAFHAEVYASGAPGAEAYTVAFRGSGGRIGDWASNGLQGIGLPSNHYARALEIGNAIGRADPALNVSFVGHSLGGGLASHAANASGRHAITFNAAGLSNASRLDGVVTAARNGVLPGSAENFAVPGEFLTTTQQALSPLVPRAFGTTQMLSGVAPEGASLFSQYGPLAPINRHMMDWVLASTAGR